MITVLIFIAILAVLVLSHELGHFIAARKSGMKVYEFGFGFPPRMFSFERRGTIYSFNWLPLGGFVRIKGEEGEEMGPDSFNTQKAWKKAITLVAGVVMNVVLAAVLLSIGFMTGIPQAVDNSTVGAKDRHVEIVSVLPGKPADQAGLKTGDQILQLDNLNLPTLQQMQDYINANKDKNIHIVINREGQQISKDIKPIIYPDTGKAGIGVSIVDVGLVGYPWYKAIYYGIITTGLYLKEIVLAFYGLIKGLFAGAPVGDAVSGPVGIAVMTGQVAKLGFAYVLNFTALLSLNLAIINILPIPALDGGRLLFLLINVITKKPIKAKHEQLAHTIGFALLMLLVVAVTVKDVGTFGGTIVNFFKKIF